MEPTERRVVLVAGGSGGIGSAVSRKLSAGGGSVYIGFASSRDRAEELVGELCANGGRATAVELDLADAKVAERACAQIFEREGRLDVLVNCVALNVEAPAAGMSDEDWSAVLEVNFTGAFRLCRAAARYMVLKRWGRIVNFSSISAIRGGRGQINYASSKAGVEAMTRVLALELGRKGVLVNCVAPGVIETALSERIRAEHGDELLREIAVRRFGCPEEVAELTAFLCSDAASYMTGQTLRVDGGMAL